MRILDRYILKDVLLTFLACLLVFLFLYVISDTLSRLEDILKHHIGIRVICAFYRASLPIMLAQTAPIAILLATIYTFGRLNRNNELIIIRSSGLSLWQIAMPVVLCGLILSLGMLIINARIIPRSQVEAEGIKKQLEGNPKVEPQEAVISNLTSYGLENRLFFINSFDVKNSAMEGITILEHDRNQNLIAKITAKRGIYKDHLWIFYEFTKLNFDPEGHIAGDGIYSQEEIMSITETPQDFIQQRKRSELMTSAQLEDYIWKLKKSTATGAVRSLLVDLHRRYSSAFTSLVLILLGIPFSFIIRKRSNIFSSFGICIALSFLYYVACGIGLALGKSGAIFPLLSCWLAPIIFSSSAVWLIQKSR